MQGHIVHQTCGSAMKQCVCIVHMYFFPALPCLIDHPLHTTNISCHVKKYNLPFEVQASWFLDKETRFVDQKLYLDLKRHEFKNNKPVQNITKIKFNIKIMLENGKCCKITTAQLKLTLKL